MKRLALVLTSTIFWAAASTAFAETRPVTLEEITDRVSNENYFVLQNAQKVYQAKQTIQLARRNLLPKLNLWRIIETPFTARGLLGIIGDIAPFLVPNNWLRVEEEKLFAEATQYGYRALWANELLTARGLLLQASLEESLKQGLEDNYRGFARIYDLVKSREDLGALPAGSATQVQVQMLSELNEIQMLDKVIRENRSQLAYILGFPGNDEAVPGGIKYVSLSDKSPLKYADYESRVITGSPEIKQYDALIKAADFVKKERYFTFLGAASLSRGTGGGVFDDLPMQDGLGFGLGPSVRIVKAQKEILKIQKQAVEETLRKDLKILVDCYNIDLAARVDATKSIAMTKTRIAALEDRMRLGDTVDAMELVQAAESQMHSLAIYHSIEIRLLLNLDRLNRMAFMQAFDKETPTIVGKK